ncbi:hypothetical protein DMH27_08800 [Raoultella planticola]|nr:hypothetical protein [Raoultella planticola]
MILVPYETLVPEMTDDFKQNQILRRAYFDGADVGHSGVILPGILLTQFGKDNAVFFYASLVFSVLCALMLTFVWFFTGNVRGKSGRRPHCGRKKRSAICLWLRASTACLLS